MHESELVTRFFRYRPVAARVRRIYQGLPMGPPTEEEKQDAILLLEEPFLDDLGAEAFRILDEYGQ